jgi:hypothetical protein
MLDQNKIDEIVKYLETQIVEYEVFMKNTNEKREPEAYNYSLGICNAFKYVRDILKEKSNIGEVP